MKKKICKIYALVKKVDSKLNRTWEGGGVGGNFERLANFFMISPVGFQKTCIQNLSFLHSLEVAKKFVVEVPEIIW